MSEIVILPKRELDDLKFKIDHLIELVESIGQTSPSNNVITNDQLIADFGISKKTAQNWRTQGLVKFMRVGRKIYYNLDDVHQTLNDHTYDSFRKRSERRRSTK